MEHSEMELNGVEYGVEWSRVEWSGMGLNRVECNGVERNGMAYSGVEWNRVNIGLSGMECMLD